MNNNSKELDTLNFRGKLIEEVYYSRKCDTTYMDEINTEEKFLEFMSYISKKIDTDRSFIMLDDRFRNHLYEIINYKRFEFKSKENMELSNKLISKINEFKNIDDASFEDGKNKFIESEEIKRDSKFNQSSELVDAIHFDYIFYNDMKKLEEVDDKNYRAMKSAIEKNFLSRKDDFISSCNFFINQESSLINKDDIYKVAQETIGLIYANERQTKRKNNNSKKSLLEKMKNLLVGESNYSLNNRLQRLEEKITNLKPKRI